MENPIWHLIICSFLANFNVDARVILLKCRSDHISFLLKILQWFPVSFTEKTKDLMTASELMIIASLTSHPYTIPLICSTPATFLSLEYTAAASGPLHWLFLCLEFFLYVPVWPLPSPFKTLLKCHLFSDHEWLCFQICTQSFPTPQSFLSSLSYFFQSCFFFQNLTC